MATADTATEVVMRALIRACRDHLRPSIREAGIDERDLAFEAGLLTPAEVDSAIYGPQKRNAILRLFRRLQGEGLISMHMAPNGVYQVLPTPKGEQFVEQLARPWYSKMWDRLRGHRQPSLQ